MAAVLGIGETVYLGLPAQRRQSDDAVVQCHTTAEDQLTPVRIGATQLHIGSREQLQTRRAYPPPPRLRVVDGGGPDGQGENRSHGFGVREMGVHGCRAFPINGCGHLLRIARRQPRWQSTKARQRRTFGPASTAPRSGEWY